MQVLIPTDADRGTRYQLNKYVDWLVDQGRQWHSPDLSAYRDYLLAAGSKHGKPLSPYTVKAHLSTIRTRYQDILKEQQATDSNSKENSDQLARFEALVDRIQKAIDPEESKVEIDQQETGHQNQTKCIFRRKRYRLWSMPRIPARWMGSVTGQSSPLWLAPESAMLNWRLLMSRICGKTAMGSWHCVSGLPSPQRNGWCPMGKMSGFLPLVEQWLQAAEIQDGAAFRSFWRGNKRLRGRLSARAVQMIVIRLHYSGWLETNHCPTEQFAQDFCRSPVRCHKRPRLDSQEPGIGDLSRRSESDRELDSRSKQHSDRLPLRGRLEYNRDGEAGEMASGQKSRSPHMPRLTEQETARGHPLPGGRQTAARQVPLFAVWRQARGGAGLEWQDERGLQHCAAVSGDRAGGRATGGTGHTGCK